MSLDDLGKQARDVVPQIERLLKDGRPRLRFLRAPFSEVEALKVDMYAERKLVQEGERVHWRDRLERSVRGDFLQKVYVPGATVLGTFAVGENLDVAIRNFWIEKILCTVLREAHERQVEKTITTLSEGPVRFDRG